MDFDSAVKTINKLLIETRPNTFNSSWIRGCTPHIYRYFQKNIRRESGGIDWDRITRALDRKFQRKWITSRRNGTKRYRSKAEVKIILRKYDGKLYTFLTPADKDNNSIRDIISIALVRIAQKGNLTARQEIIKLVRLTIDEWIEHNPRIFRWKGYEYLLQKSIEDCIRRYRYSGSFMGYLFKTLEYAGGLRPIVVHSLDDSPYPGGPKRIDRIAQNPETGEILLRPR
jgi:CYTH domain-containing protein